MLRRELPFIQSQFIDSIELLMGSRRPTLSLGEPEASLGPPDCILPHVAKK